MRLEQEKLNIRLTYLSLILLLSLTISCSSETALIAQLPIYEVKASVISLNLDANDECLGECSGYEYPKDNGVIRINNIISVSNPSDVAGEGFKAGDIVEVVFSYSARPAIIIFIPSTSSAKSLPPEVPVSNIPSFANPIPFENGLFIFSIETSSVSIKKEVNLPGLREGSVIRAFISLETPSKGIIGEYGGL